VRHTLIALTAFVALGASILAGQQKPKDDTMKMPMPSTMASTEAKIGNAMKAAPSDISAKAAIMDWPAKDGMPMKHLRSGTNGWTCMPSTPVSARLPGQEDPMCVDPSFTKLLEAYEMKADPHVTSVGIGYMLLGDKGVSNTDPFAMMRTATNNWIESPAHLMVVVPDARQLDAYPSDPHAGGPWVMWKGTKYAHLMVPITNMPMHE